MSIIDVPKKELINKLKAKVTSLAKKKGHIAGRNWYKMAESYYTICQHCKREIWINPLNKHNNNIFIQKGNCSKEK